MSIRQSVYAIIQYIPLVVKCTQTELRHLYRVDDMIRRSKRAKSAHCVFAGVSQNLQKLAMAYMFLNVMLLDAFGLSLRLCHIARYVQTVM